MWGRSQADKGAPSPGAGGRESVGGMSTGGGVNRNPAVVPLPNTNDSGNNGSSGGGSGKAVILSRDTGNSSAPHRSNMAISPLNVSGIRETPGDGGSSEAEAEAGPDSAAAVDESGAPPSTKTKHCDGVNDAEAFARDSRQLSARLEGSVSSEGAGRGSSDRSGVDVGDSGSELSAVASAVAPPNSAPKALGTSRKLPSVGAYSGEGSRFSSSPSFGASFSSAVIHRRGGSGGREGGDTRGNEITIAAPAVDARDAGKGSSHRPKQPSTGNVAPGKRKLVSGVRTDGRQEASGRADVGGGTEEEAIADGGVSSMVGKAKKPVATRFGGRMRTPSFKYQEFKEVQQTKAKGTRRGSGGGGGGAGGYGSSGGGSGGGADQTDIEESHSTTRPPPHSSSSSSSSLLSSFPGGAGLSRKGSEEGGEGGREMAVLAAAAAAAEPPAAAVVPPSAIDPEKKQQHLHLLSLSPRPAPASATVPAPVPAPAPAPSPASAPDPASGSGSGSVSALTVSNGGGGSGARGGMGEVAATAQAARRDKKIDTVVLAKCRRKSQTMWPARLCSKREILDRMVDPEPADEGVDPRYMCLVVFLCEGGHHVTDWVTPASMRPYLSHAAAYPYKKRAYAGTARLQPDFNAAEAWAEELKSVAIKRRVKARDRRRVEAIKNRKDKSRQAKLEGGRSSTAIGKRTVTTFEPRRKVGRPATADGAVIGDSMVRAESSARRVKTEKVRKSAVAVDSEDPPDLVTSADILSDLPVANEAATEVETVGVTPRSLENATKVPAVTAREGSSCNSARQSDRESTGDLDKGYTSPATVPANATRKGGELDEGMGTVVVSEAAAVADGDVVETGRKEGEQKGSRKRVLSSGGGVEEGRIDVVAAVARLGGGNGAEGAVLGDGQQSKEGQRPRKRHALESKEIPATTAASTPSAASTLLLPTASPPNPTTTNAARRAGSQQPASVVASGSETGQHVGGPSSSFDVRTIGEPVAMTNTMGTAPDGVSGGTESMSRSAHGAACATVLTAGSGERSYSDATAAAAAVASQDNPMIYYEQTRVPAQTTAKSDCATTSTVTIGSPRPAHVSSMLAPGLRPGDAPHKALPVRSRGPLERGGSGDPPANAHTAKDDSLLTGLAAAEDIQSFDGKEESSSRLTASPLANPAAAGDAETAMSSAAVIGAAKEAPNPADIALSAPTPEQQPFISFISKMALGVNPDTKKGGGKGAGGGDRMPQGAVIDASSTVVRGARSSSPVIVSGSQVSSRVAAAAAVAVAGATERLAEVGRVFDATGRNSSNSAAPRAVRDGSGGEKNPHHAVPDSTGAQGAAAAPGAGMGYGMPGGFGAYKFNMAPTAPAAAMHSYSRGFYRSWQEGGGPHPTPHPYSGTFSPYGRYSPMGPGMSPSGGYGFAPPAAAFFGAFPTATGYPPHHVGRAAPFSPVYSAGMPYGAQSGTGGGRGVLEGRVASPEGGGGVGGLLDQGQGIIAGRGRSEGRRGDGQRLEEEKGRGAQSSHVRGDGYGQTAAGGELGRQDNPAAAAAAHAVAAHAAAAHAAAAVTNRSEWTSPWHDPWTGSGGGGGVPGFAAAAMASGGGGLSGLVSPGEEVQGEEEQKPSETLDSRNILSNMLDEDPSERRRKCDHDECQQMATHGFILPRLCGLHKEARMLRIVPPDVYSGDEWGSDAEADARDVGRFRRIAGADHETIRYALKLYPPRTLKTRDKIYAEFGLGPPPGELSDVCEIGSGGSGGSSKSGGGSASRGNRGRGIQGGASAGEEAVGRTGDDSGVGEENSGVATTAVASQSLPTYKTTGTQPPRLRKNDHALLAAHGVHKPKGKHPGYIVTLYGKKVRRCAVCPQCLAADCGRCRFCEDMPKFGGKGSSKQHCEARKCAWVEYDRSVKAVVTQLQNRHNGDETGEGNGDGNGNGDGAGGGVEGGGVLSPRARGGLASPSSRSPRSSAAGSPGSRLSSQGSVRGRPRSRAASVSASRGAPRKVILKARKRCGECKGCNATECGRCKFCKDMPKNGGPGRSRQASCRC